MGDAGEVQLHFPALPIISIAIISPAMNETLGFLLNDTARLFRRAMDERARVTGVTSLQWRMLARVARAPGMRQNELADLLEVEPITVSRMIDRLVESGLLERRSDPDDRRAWRIYLTTGSAPQLDTLRAIATEIRDEAFAGITNAQLAQMHDTLDAIRANLSRQKPQIGPNND